MTDSLLLPFQFPFMQNAFWIALIGSSPSRSRSASLSETLDGSARNAPT